MKVRLSISNPDERRKMMKIITERWIKRETKKWYGKINVVNRLALMTYEYLTKELHHLEIEWIIEETNEMCNTKSQELKEKKKKKIERLREEQQHKNPEKKKEIQKSFAPRVVNMSKMSLKEEELELLNKGLKFAIPPDKEEEAKTRVLIDMEYQNTGDGNLMTQCYEHLKTKPIQTGEKNTKRVITNLKKRMAQQDTIITRADKSNAVVLMNKSDYKKKMEETLENGGAIEDPTFNFETHVKKTRELINGSSHIIRNQKEKLRILEPNPVPPRLYGMPKLHKEDAPMRPVISYISAPTYSLAKLLNDWVRSIVDITSRYAVKNSINLAKNLKEVVPPTRSTLNSFDVRALFPSIHLETATTYLMELLSSAGIDQVVLVEFKKLLEICLKPNYCKFNNKYYIFPNEIGVPIGSPLGSLLGEVFMRKLEEDLFDSRRLYRNFIVYWWRYVDDVLLLWNGPSTLLDHLHDFLNEQYPSIKFTIEKSNKRINFLDISISIEKGSHEFEIHRKNTSTDLLIQGDSFTPPSHKLAAFHSMAHRLLNIPLSDSSFRREVQVMEYLKEVNGVRLDINQLIIKKHIKMVLNKTTSISRVKQNSDRKSRWLKIPYLGKFTKSLSRELRPYRRKITHYNYMTMYKIFGNNKDKIPREEKSGVYRLKCGECDSIYIGETSRKVRMRLHEHITAYLDHKPEKSAYAEHLINSGHDPQKTECKLIHIEYNYRRRIALEKLEIMKHLHQGEKILNKYIPEGGIIEKTFPIPNNDKDDSIE